MKRIISICFLIAFFINYNAHAQYRSAAFTVQHEQTEQTVSLGQTFETDGNIELALSSLIYGFSVSGSVTLKDTSNSLVRITLVDSYEMEYLVYEIYPLLTQQWQFDFDNMGFETSTMDGASISKIKISVLNAELTLKEYHYTTEPARSIQRQQRFKTQQQYIIETLNANLEARDIPWRAGETSVSKLSYEEKKNLFGGTVPNLNGFEYYIGGIFVMPDYQPESNAQTQEAEPKATVPSSWDWRNKDGKNWMTPVKNQGSCGSCWAFTAIGAIEAYANIHFDYLINLDLSEQELVSCIGLGDGCNGGLNINALDYVYRHGIVDEKSFPYKEENGKCPLKMSYDEQVKIKGYDDFNIKKKTEADLKQLLIQSPLCIAMTSMQHAMTLVGYKTVRAGDKIYFSDSTKSYIIIDSKSPLIGTTAWLVKNSWGTSFGDNGYGYICVKWEDFHNVCSIKNGIASSKCMVVNTATTWDEEKTIDTRLFVLSGGVLTISSSVTLGNAWYIVVKNGGKLIIDGGVLNNASIEVESGGHLQIVNNGTINLRSTAALDIKNGGTLDFSSGYIN